MIKKVNNFELKNTQIFKEPQSEIKKQKIKEYNGDKNKLPKYLLSLDEQEDCFIKTKEGKEILDIATAIIKKNLHS